MENKYLNTKTKFNENTFDKQELFDTVEEILRSNKFPIDDLKANITYNEYLAVADWDNDEFQVNCLFSWIFYPEDVPKKEFVKISNQIEEIFTEEFNIQFRADIDCIRYADSEYSDHGYDVELRLHLDYNLDTE